MDVKKQAEDFYLGDAEEQYRKENYTASSGLCRIVLIINPQNKKATNLLKQAEIALTELQKRQDSVMHEK